MANIFSGILEAAAGITPEIKARFHLEKLCRRCGRCCYSGIRIKNKMVLLKDLPCKHLTYEPAGSAFCTVYQTRELTGWCNKISVESIRKELFPPDCPYVKNLPHYKGKIELSDQKFEEIKPVLRNVFKIMDKPDYVRGTDWERFIQITLGLKLR